MNLDSIKKLKITGIDMASGPDRTVIVLHPCMREWDPEYIKELEAMKSVELIWMDSVKEEQTPVAKPET